MREPYSHLLLKPLTLPFALQGEDPARGAGDLGSILPRRDDSLTSSENFIGLNVFWC